MIETEKTKSSYHEHEAYMLHRHDWPIFQPGDMGETEHVPVDAEHGFIRF
jgi:hypothetical protein